MTASAPPPLPPPSLTAAILEWYSKHRRDLPWRRTSDPYAIWVSEVMLQQTQVVTVIPYYERFLARFPTLVTLASASLDDVLSMWQGLGYYARARHLHAAAHVLVEKQDARIPENLAALRALPGMGDYISAAVASIAFHVDVAAVDANIARVLSRVLDYADDVRSLEGRRALQAYATLLLPAGRAGDFNQAMMELGATICLPRDPQCAVCPLAGACESRRRGSQADRPLRRARGPLPWRVRVALCCEVNGRLLLVRRMPAGLLGGLWEIPAVDVMSTEEETAASARVLRVALGIHGEVGEPIARVKHAYTHFVEELQVYRGTLAGEPTPAKAWDALRWMALAEMRDVGLTGITVKVLRALGWPIPG